MTADELAVLDPRPFRVMEDGASPPMSEAGLTRRPDDGRVFFRPRAKRLLGIRA